MFRFLTTVPRVKFTPRLYVYANTDTSSNSKIDAFEGDCKDVRRCVIPRSREVGQSFGSSVFTTLYAFLFSFPLMLRERPDVVCFYFFLGVFMDVLDFIEWAWNCIASSFFCIFFEGK